MALKMLSPEEKETLVSYRPNHKQQLEVLLDIRELLIELNNKMK